MNIRRSVEDFFHELRRRRVLRVIVVYLVVSWPTIEVVSTVAPTLALPEWTASFVVLMLLIGFPLAVILAWAYEFTPDGLRRTESMGDEGAPGPPITRQSAAVRMAPPRRNPANRESPRAPGIEVRPIPQPDAGQLRRAVVASLRHDFRTPLIAVLGYSEMLQEDATPEQTPLLQEIETAGRRALTTIDELLHPPSPGEAFSEEALDDIRHRIRETLAEPTADVVTAARAAAESELVSEGMRPDLNRIVEAAVHLHTLTRDEPTSTGAGSDPSTGEGSSRDAAAHIIATLPSRGAPIARVGVPRHGQILVVDDNEDSRELLSRQLAREGFSVSVAADGEAALRSLRAQDFDLVLLDVLMPGLDGIEVLLRMQSDPATADLPVIMTSALDQMDGVVRCIEQGAVDYLMKPFDPILLKARVGATLDLHRLRAQQRRAMQELDEEVARSDHLIRSMVPESLVERVRDDRGTLVEGCEGVTVLAATIEGLGTFAARHGTIALGEWLEETVKSFDAILRTLPVAVHWEGVATLIVSAGMQCAEEERMSCIADLALRLRAVAAARTAEAQPVRIGIGIHTGAAVSGVISGERIGFGAWGEGPDVARELAWQCRSGEALVSPATCAALHGRFAFEERGMIETSDGSRMRAYGLVGGAGVS